MLTAYYPVFLNLQQQKCVVVGGGEVAVRKVNSLLNSEALVDVISPCVHPKLSALAAVGRIKLTKRLYQKGDTAGALLVIAATDQKEINQQVAVDCAEDSVLCNVVDSPALCDFIVSSVLQQGPLTIAVSTSGQAPAAAKQITQSLQQKYDETYGIVIELLGQFRRRLLQEVAEPEQRQSLLTSLELEELVELYRRGGQAALEYRMAALMDGIN